MRQAAFGISAVFAAVCVVAGSAYAGPLDTGLNANGSLIAPGAVDSAWIGQDVSNPRAPVNLTAYAVSGYNAAWLSDAAARFITPLADTTGNAVNYGGAATITWTQDFTLTANQAASDIVGRYAVDNALNELLVNGHVVAGVSGGSFTAFTNFDIPVADLLLGNNVIAFVTQNYSGSAGNPTGLMVEFTEVPEPASLALLSAGLVGLVFLRRRVA